ncbi:unnamed protein product [Meganyctiphanes norvegica]|uniref:Transmembrane protein 132E n=1 Tax=Meganyctiphanes norvegica TaxID=48144 RepID=A0AAV2Q5C0_MEGNR
MGATSGLLRCRASHSGGEPGSDEDGDKSLGVAAGRGRLRVPPLVPAALLLLLLLLEFITGSAAVDLHFQNPDSGFFLRPEESVTLNEGVGVTQGDDGGVLDVERFTVLDPTRPALIRATYGPFSTKQTVPARYVLPEFPDDEPFNVTDPQHHLPPQAHQLEVSAHLVTTEITRAQPTLRVLVHGAGARGHHSPHVCVTVIARKGSDALSASCTPAGAGETGGDATCLVTMAIPSRWWPPHTRATVKLPKVAVQVSYMVGTASGPRECVNRDAGGLESGGGARVTVQPETEVGDVVLELDPLGYEELKSDHIVHVLVPRAPLHPGALLHAPLYLHPPGNLPPIILMLRCKVRGNIRVAGVEAATSAWNLTVEVNARRTAASVTAMLVDQSPSNATLHTLGLHEVLSWVLEIPEDSPAGEARVTWSLRYVMDAEHHETFAGPGNDVTKRMATRITILKDDVQAVLPISKSWSVVNTAVLTGRQVSRAMKVLIVSQAGKVADVTLQSSCSCTDEAALKVSASCTSVYLDGSEVHGSHNATVVARYGQQTGAASFTVWMPELPLNVHVKDTKLSQIRGWRAPDPATTQAYAMKLHSAHENELATLNEHPEEAVTQCSVRYQQTPVEVYGRFVAVDDNSGRQSYLLSRRAQVRVTELVAHLLRVADNSVAMLDHTTLRGRSPGRTEVQVLSPITGRVIGAREVRVGSDKVWVSRLRAAVISGLTLSLQPDSHLPDGYSAVTAVTPTLTAKYQEGLVDVWVELSDGVVVPLREVPPAHYNLRVRSLDPNIVAVAPSPRTAQPRVIAIGHGEGDLLQVSLEIPEECERRRSPLATTDVHVKVDLGSTVSPLNEINELNSNSISEDMNKVSDSELPHADAAAPYGHLLPMAEQPQRHPSVQARHHPNRPQSLTPLEVGMYVLLAVFGAASVVFAASCVVYTWRVRGGKPLLPHPGEHQRMDVDDMANQDSVTNAHDWVWLGRATLERASGIGMSPPPSYSSDNGNIPLSDLNGNSQLLQQQQMQESGWLQYHKMTHGYERHSAPINITHNPGADNDESLSLTSKHTDSATFTRPSNRRRVTFNNLCDDNTLQSCSSEEEKPPIPPHRNIGVSTNPSQVRYKNPQDDTKPPPIPPHGVNVTTNPMDSKHSFRDHGKDNRAEIGSFTYPSQQQQQQIYTQHQQLLHTTHIRQPEELDDDEKDKGTEKRYPDPKFVEINGDDFVRLRGVCRGRAGQVRRATILENPLLSTNLPDNFSVTEHLDNLPPTMDYDQMMDYFSNLKESNA